MVDERRAHDLLGRLLGVPAADREAWLAAEIPDDPELRARLLAAVPVQSVDAVSDAPTVPLKLSWSESPSDDPLVGQRLGAFVVEARLPEQGGMGVVYRGRRVDGTFEQDVAIKIIPRGRDTDGLLRRFTLERRVLGLLQHAHIVRILDAGAVSDGRPYLVMEWVDGLPLDRFCADGKLNLRRRLELFQQVCAAVQYAHQHFVVHRDLKPGNVLVTPAGAPKILDFGLAKVLDDDDHYAAVLSRTNERPMTPAYASPEQVRGGGVTTATDVYTLGLILYELLAGRRPYRLTSSSGTEIERVICEEEPEPPSRAARDAAGAAGSQPPVAPKQLQGELDAIVMRALEKQPGGRYPTAAALSEDIARYLDGRPVLARRTSLAYRSAKFAKQHAKVLAAAAVVVLLTGAFVVQNVLHGRRLAVERDRAQASLRFLVSLFEASGPAKAKGDKITAVELLDRGVQRLETELRNQPETRASILFTIGNVYDLLGRYDDAERLLVESVALLRNASSRPTLELADALNTLGRLYGTTGNAKKGDGLYLEALQIRRALLRADDPLVAKSLTNLASIRAADGDLEGAVAGYREAFAIMQSRSDPDRAIPLVNVSSILFNQGKYAESLDAAREAWETNEKVHGPDHPTTLKARASMAWALFSLSEYARAVEAQRDLVDRNRRVFGDVHYEVAEAWYTLGTMVAGAGRFDDAEHALRESEKIWRKLPGILEDRLAWTLSALAGVLARTGKYAESEALHHEALALRKRHFGENSPGLGESLGGLGHLYYRWGRFVEAEKYFRMNLDILRKDPRGQRWVLAYPETALGRLLTEQARVDEAEPLLRHALEGLRQDLPSGHERIAYAEALLGDCLTRRSRFDEAAPLLEDGVRILREKKSGSEDTVYAEGRLAALFDAWGKPEKAAEWRVSLPKKTSSRPEVLGSSRSLSATPRN